MTAPPMLLLCDHRGEGLAEGVRSLGAVGFHVEVSENLGQTREWLASHQPDIVVVDALSRTGLVELEQIDQARQASHVPVLVVADPMDPLPTVNASRALRSGPWDLVYRGAPLEELLLRIERLRDQVVGLAELDEMRYRAVHDDRTGLLRPSAFQTRLREHFSAAQRHHFDVALILIDLDDFGAINKSFDHTIGDKVITRVGQVIANTLRKEDAGGRLGGDEFSVVLPYTRRIDAARVVSRIREQIHLLSGPLEDLPGDVRVSASLGFETFDGVDLDSVEILRRHAELALRKAKNMGGNRGLYYRSLDSEQESGLELGQGIPSRESDVAPVSESADQDRA